MKATQLSYEIITSNTVPATITINMEDICFLRAVRLTSMSGFPTDFLSTYQLQVHPKFIKFIQINQNITGMSVQNLSQVMDKLLRLVRKRVVKIKNKTIEKQNLYDDMFRLLQFNSCCGYKLHTKNTEKYSAGDLVLFYLVPEQGKVNELVDCIQGFSSKVVHYPLGSLIRKFNLPEDLVLPSLKQMLNFHASQIEAVAVLYKILISFMAICRRFDTQEMDAQKQFFLALNIQGVISNAHLFYLALEHTIQSFRPRLIKIESIRTIKLKQISTAFEFVSGTRMIDSFHVMIMDRHIEDRQIQQTMIGDYIFGKDKFNEEDRSILKFQISRDRFQDQINRKQIQIKNIQVQSSQIVVTCDYNIVLQVMKFLKQFLSQFQKQTVKCTQFQTPLVRTIFYKNYRKQIEQEFNVKFELVNGEITRTNYTIYTQKIIAELMSVNDRILENFVEVPSLNTISKYLAKINNFQGLYSIEKNPECMWQKSWKTIKYRWAQSKVSIFLTEFGNLVKFQQHIVFIMHNDLLDSSKIYSISAENNIKTKEFLADCEGPKPSRARKYPIKGSQRFGSITLLYFDVKRVNIRHIDDDIYNCLKAFEKQQKINILIGLNSKRFIDQIMVRFLNKANQLAKQSEIKLKYLNVYYEDPALLSHLERMVINTKMQATLIARDLLNQWSLLRMNNLKEYVLSYFWNGETWTLPGMDSYIFQFQRKRSTKLRALLTIPTPQYLQNLFHQYLINFQTDTVYQICNFYHIAKHETRKVSKTLQKLAKIIENQFNPIYFVAYARNIENQIGKQVCLSIYYTHEAKKQQLIPLQINIKTGEVGLKQSDPLPFNLSQKKYVDWFKINTHISEVHNVEACLQK